MKNITKQDAESRLKEFVQSLNELHKELWTIDYKNRMDNKPLTHFFYQLRYEKLFTDPISKKPQNFVEILNQTYTYIITFKAILFLYEKNLVPSTETFEANIGNQTGVDLKSTNNLVVAEVFTAVTKYNNGKLTKDIIKVKKEAKKINPFNPPAQYVFFYIPGIPSGEYTNWTITKTEKTNGKTTIKDITGQYQDVKVYCLDVNL